MTPFEPFERLPSMAQKIDMPLARFAIGDVVKHRIFDFRGVVFDVDPEFANSDEWYDAIPEEIRPPRDQPFYHLLAENGEGSPSKTPEPSWWMSDALPCMSSGARVITPPKASAIA